jgi:hypothetical protein
MKRQAGSPGRLFGGELRRVEIAEDTRKRQGQECRKEFACSKVMVAAVFDDGTVLAWIGIAGFLVRARTRGRF